MRFLFLITVFFSNNVWAQVDTVNLKKIRFEVVAEAGLMYGSTSKIGYLPEGADIFMNNSKNIGSNVQWGLQTYFFNKILLGVEYAHDKFNSNGSKIDSEIKISNRNYFIQGEPKFAQSSGPVSLGDYSIQYLRVGLGGNIKLTKSKYLQPYVCYGIGRGLFPHGKYAYKDNFSNDFYTNDFSFNSLVAKGYVGGIRYKYFADANTEEPSVAYSHIGIKLEFCYMDIIGHGKILRTEGYTKQESSVSFDVSKHYQYITLGVFVGLGLKGKKYSNSFLFSTYPIKKRKTLKERMHKH